MFSRLLRLLLFAGVLSARAEPLPRRESNFSIRNEVQLAIDQGLTHLAGTQRADGSWGKLGVTGFAVMALQRNPRGRVGESAPALEKGEAALKQALLEKQQDDFAWNGPPALLALRPGDPAHRRGWSALAKTPPPRATEPLAIFLIALRLNEVPSLPLPQPPSGSGLAAWIFAEVTCGLNPSDPRIATALAQLGRLYTLERNPGGDSVHQYYFLLSAALVALDIPDLTRPDGHKIDVARQLAERLINAQNSNGSWSCASDDWTETDPDLVTSYCVLALEAIYGLL